MAASPNLPSDSMPWARQVEGAVEELERMADQKERALAVLNNNISNNLAALSNATAQLPYRALYSFDGGPSIDLNRSGTPLSYNNLESNAVTLPTNRQGISYYGIYVQLSMSSTFSVASYLDYAAITLRMFYDYDPTYSTTITYDLISTYYTPAATSGNTIGCTLIFVPAQAFADNNSSTFSLSLSGLSWVDNPTVVSSGSLTSTIFSILDV